MEQKIIPNLWFAGNAEEAVDFYVSCFPDSRILYTAYYPAGADEGLADFQTDLAGEILTIEFELGGQNFVAINAGPEFAFNEAISLEVRCKDQAEIDWYWEWLSDVPEAEQCGWCKDRFGLPWQVAPENIRELMEKPHAFAHLMEMKKLIIADF